MRAQTLGNTTIRTPDEIYRELDTRVISQEKAKRVVAVAAYNHLKRIHQFDFHGRTNLRKSNVLLIGPTGVGKTHIARAMAEILDLPFVVVDATEYTEAGYYGKDVEVMVAELLYSVDLNVKKCERGIIFVDEIDKVARRTGGMRTGAGSRDIGGEGVQQALLKLLEGRKIFVPHNISQHWNKHDFVEVDTTNILFICAGTFTDVRGYLQPGSIGFSKNGVKAATLSRKITHNQLLEFGMLSEMLGRLPVIVQLDALSAKDLTRVLTEPPDSVLKEYTELLRMDEVELVVTSGAIREVAEFACRRQIGARGLRSILEEVMHDYLFDAPKLRKKTVRITPKIVRQKLENFDASIIGS